MICKRYSYLSLLLLIIFLILSTFTYGQFKYIGGGVGLNLSKLNYKNDLQEYEFNFRNGCRTGVFIEYKISNSFLMHTEVYYTMRGTEYGLDEKESIGLVIPKHKFIQKLNYVEVPIIFQYYIPIESIIKPKIFIGSEISFLLNAKIEYIENDVSQIERDEKNHFKSNEYGIVIGIGTDYKLFPGKLIFDVRYYYGISNINKIEANKVISNTISINLGYGFQLL